MDDIINSFTVGGVVGIALVVGITQLLKYLLNIEGRAAVVLSLGVAIVVAGLGALVNFYPESEQAVYYVVVALVLWLTSAGAYSAGATVARGFRKDAAKAQARDDAP